MPLTGQALETALAGSQDPSAQIQVIGSNGPLAANHHRPDTGVTNDQTVSGPSADPSTLDIM